MWKIKWSYIRLSNPECGFISRINTYCAGGAGQTPVLWFSCPVEKNQFKEKEDKEIIINIYKLDKELMDILEKDHTEYCKVSGAPLNHGDKYNFSTNRPPVGAPPVVGTTGNPGGEQIKKAIVPTSFKFTIAPQTVTGELIDTIKMSDIINFHQTKEI
jgi:hypothetical protein